MGRAAHDTNSLPVHWSPSVAPDREASLADMLDWIDRQCPTSAPKRCGSCATRFPTARWRCGWRRSSTLMRR